MLEKDLPFIRVIYIVSEVFLFLSAMRSELMEINFD